jgi:hypothetical protein
MLGSYGLLFMSVANLITSIIITVFNAKENWKWIFLSLVNILLFLVLFLKLTQVSYETIAKKEGTCCFKIFSGLACFISGFYSVFPLAFCHGFIAMIFRKPTTIFCIISPIESCCWLIVMGLIGFGTYRGCKVFFFYYSLLFLF